MRGRAVDHGDNPKLGEGGLVKIGNIQAFPRIWRTGILIEPEALQIHPMQITHTLGGAGEGTRTPYLNLGKVALCQVSYSRYSMGSISS
jgi:hypothetical protein